MVAPALEAVACPILSLLVDFDRSGVRLTVIALTLPFLEAMDAEPVPMDPVVVLRRCSVLDFNDGKSPSSSGMIASASSRPVTSLRLNDFEMTGEQGVGSRYEDAVLDLERDGNSATGLEAIVIGTGVASSKSVREVGSGSS